MSNQIGYIKLHRKILDNFLFTEKREFTKREAWIHILLTVNFAEANVLIGNELFVCKRGESLKSLDSWAKEFYWTKSKVRRFFILLQSCSMIELNSVQKSTRLTVCNYDAYQDERNTNETQTKRKRNANETQTTPREEEEEELRRINKNKNIIKTKIERENDFNENVKKLVSEFKDSKFWNEKNILNFCNYWTQSNDNSEKMHYEKQKTFDLKKRLAFWESNSYNQNKAVSKLEIYKVDKDMRKDPNRMKF